MTVEELIEVLKRYSPDYTVYAHDLTEIETCAGMVEPKGVVLR